MTYKKEFIATICVNGKSLREIDERVFLPFGTEYSILLINKSNKRALVKIEIDGRNVTGGGIIVPHYVGENRVVLERFLDNDDLEKGYKFKFIERTKEISEYRGDKEEDGLIKIEYWFEKPKEDFFKSMYPRTKKIEPWFDRLGGDVIFQSSISNSYNTQNLNSRSMNDEGITVEGSDSNQKYKYASMGELEKNSNLIFFQLKGVVEDSNKENESSEVFIKKPVMVESKYRCTYCGKVWDSSHKFCGGCGARLLK